MRGENPRYCGFRKPTSASATVEKKSLDTRCSVPIRASASCVRVLRPRRQHERLSALNAKEVTHPRGADHDDERLSAVCEKEVAQPPRPNGYSTRFTTP